MADDPGWHRKAMRLGGGVQSSQGGAATDPGAARHRIDLDVV